MRSLTAELHRSHRDCLDNAAHAVLCWEWMAASPCRTDLSLWCHFGVDDSCDGGRVYIDAEEKGLRETLETLIREESWKPMEDAAQTNVLRSASELFAVIKKSLQRCSRFVSRSEPMLCLMGAFQVEPPPPALPSLTAPCYKVHSVPEVTPGTGGYRPRLATPHYTSARPSWRPPSACAH